MAGMRGGVAGKPLNGNMNSFSVFVDTSHVNRSIYPLQKNLSIFFNLYVIFKLEV